MTSPLNPVEIPDRMPGQFAADAFRRRAARWLADRAAGTHQTVGSSVKFIPKTPEQQAAWRARKPSQSDERPRRAYVSRRSAVEAYCPPPKPPIYLPKPKKGPPATTPEPAPVAPAGEGVVRIVSRPRSRRHQAGAQAGASKRARPSPSGGPAISRKPRARRRPRSAASPAGRPDLQNLDRQILHWLGL